MRRTAIFVSRSCLPGIARQAQSRRAEGRRRSIGCGNLDCRRSNVANPACRSGSNPVAVDGWCADQRQADCAGDRRRNRVRQVDRADRADPQHAPGLGSHPKLGRQLNELIEDLGASQFDRREAAQQALIKLGAAARGELERRQDVGEKERRTRIKAILAELDEREQAFDADLDEPTANDGEMIQQDTVETMQFTIVGRVVPQEFTINSPYGPLHVKLSDIRSADRDVMKSETLRKSLAVEGTHLAPAGMKPARTNLQRGDRVSISASGTITMTPWGSRAFSTPDGASNYGWYVQNEIPGGALVAKIGDSGPIFKVGSKHAFVADRSGELQLGVAAANNPHPHNQAFPGQYNVNVVVRRK